MLTRVANRTYDEVQYSLLCWWHQLRRSETARAKLLVNGSPKSGTTWMLKLLASLPGFYEVPNFRGEIERYAEVQPGGVVHGHDSYSDELWSILSANSIKVILMVRDPRDQAVSRMFHVRRDTTHKWNETMNGLSDHDALMVAIEGDEGMRGASGAFQLTESWLRHSHLVHCVKYEDLIADTATHFRGVLDYLGISLSDRLLQNVVERNHFRRLSAGRKIWQAGRHPGQADPNSHFRKGIVGDWKNYFTEEHVQRFKELAGASLIELGYEQNDNWHA